METTTESSTQVQAEAETRLFKAMAKCVCVYPF